MQEDVLLLKNFHHHSAEDCIFITDLFKKTVAFIPSDKRLCFFGFPDDDVQEAVKEYCHKNGISFAE